MPLPVRADSFTARRFTGALVAVGLVAAVAALYVLRLDHVAGLIGDDAWYVVMAKAMAEGLGPRLISSAGEPVLSPIYPPGFPAFLSLVFLINPQFPDNLLLLKGVSVIAVLGAGLLTYRFAVQYRGLSRPVAAALALAMAITPALVFLATSTLMSEAVFLCVQLLAVLAVERAARADAHRSGRWALLAGVLAAAAVLIRTAGVTIVAAAVLYLVGTRRWRSAVLFSLAALLCVLPWSIYARTHAATRAQLVDLGGVMAVDYGSWFWTSEAGTVRSRQVDLNEIPARVARNITNITIRDMGGIFMPLLFRTPAESGLETIGLGPPEDGKVPSMGAALGTQVISFAITVLAVIGFVVACRRRVTVAEPLVALAFVMIALWPFWTFRFVLPLVPFLLGYLVIGVETLAGLLARAQQRLAFAPSSAARMFLLILIGLNALDHVQYIAQAYGNERGGPWKAHAADMNEVFGWLQRHGDREAVVAADNPALVYLRTGRHTVALDSVDDRWSRWQRMAVRYVVSLSDGQPIDDPHRSTLRFKLTDKNLWIVELLPRHADAGASIPDS